MLRYFSIVTAAIRFFIAVGDLGKSTGVKLPEAPKGPHKPSPTPPKSLTQD
jgi:hypothetical protein